LNKKAALTAFLFIIFTTVCYANSDMKSWRYSKELKGIPAAKDSYAVFQPDEEIFDASKPDMTDLRIVDGAGYETQYNVIAAQEITESSKNNAEIIKREFTPYKKGYSIVVLDTGEIRYPINQVDFDISNDNFLKKVEVSGSNELDIWHAIQSNEFIYSVGEKGIKSASLVFDTVKFRYLKLKIYDDVKDSLNIKSAIVWFNNTHSQKDRIEYQHVTTRNEDKSNKASSLLIDLKYNNIPVDTIEIITDEVDFNRKIEIQAGNQIDRLNNLVDTGEIYSYNLQKLTAKKTDVSFNEVSARYIKLMIHNNDNQPLQIKQVKVSGDKKKIIFKTKPENKYYVYYGGHDVQSPNYEIKNILPYVDIEKLPVYTLGAQENNTQYVSEKNKPAGEANGTRIYLLIVLAIMCIVLLLLIVKAFKKTVGER